MREVQKTLGREVDFTYDPPDYVPPARVITDSKIILRILRDSTSYTILWSRPVRQLRMHRHTAGGSSPGAIKQQKLLRQAVLGPKDSAIHFARLIEAITSDLTRNKSYKLLDDFEVDIVKHVAALSWTRFVARLCYVPLKDSLNPKAKFDDRELYDKMAIVFQYVYRNEDSTRSSALKQAALQANMDLTKELGEVCEAIKCSSFAHVLLHRDRKVSKTDLLQNHGDELLQRLFDGGKTVEEVASLAVLLAVELAVSGSFAVSTPNHASLVWVCC